jgi:hypothetical protein
MAVPGLAVVVAAGLAACSEADTDVAIEVEPASSAADEVVAVRVTGADAGQAVELTAEMPDADGVVWRGTAVYEADDEGVVDLAVAEPIEASFEGADAMGLMTYLEPEGGNVDVATYIPQEAAVDLVVTATAEGRDPATATVERLWAPEDLVVTDLDPAADGVGGRLLEPSSDGDVPAGLPAVLVVGGMGGGPSLPAVSQGLALRGYPVLSLAYYRSPGLPDVVEEYPIEYFADAAALLAERTGGPVTVLASGRAVEAALLLARERPDLVERVVAESFEAGVGPGFPSFTGTAWSVAGQPVPTGPLELDGLTVPLLMVAGAGDALFGAASAAGDLHAQIGEVTGSPEPLIYENAGHQFLAPPYIPGGTGGTFEGQAFDRGGTREGQETARRDAWPQVLDFLAGGG